ncbi:hypothetical protein ALMP_00230 [Streptomyces sp. A012304]|nr:hypothetical protein ALMP_00230 [Streptomyces sp. A012304]
MPRAKRLDEHGPDSAPEPKFLPATGGGGAAGRCDAARGDRDVSGHRAAPAASRSSAARAGAPTVATAGPAPPAPVSTGAAARSGGLTATGGARPFGSGPRCDQHEQT